MTQLVELSKGLEALAAEGLKVYAITYDAQDALAAFAAKYDIGYHLLADEGSEVIRRYGILNTLIDPDDPNVHPQTGQSFYGIPFPGTYVTDENGVVTEKFFFRHYANRASAGTILDSALGEMLVHEEAPHAEAREQMATFAASLADEALRLEVTSHLRLRIDMEEGFHVYADPLPDGFIATTVEVVPTPGLRVGEVVYPATRRKAFPELGVELNVYEDGAVVEVPVTVTFETLDWARQNAGDPGSIRVPLRVHYQACSETVCYRPRTAEIEVDVPLAPLVMPGG
ncbi:MAG: redoxin domain-containing protein [Thermoanaerobaculia bacterium]|nr:redoxin domain-containing protein [Thermoanaerobaculia bacterium]